MKKVKVLVIVDGGLVQDVYCTHPRMVDVEVVDNDAFSVGENGVSLIEAEELNHEDMDRMVAIIQEEARQLNAEDPDDEEYK